VARTLLKKKAGMGKVSRGGGGDILVDWVRKANDPVARSHDR